MTALSIGELEKPKYWKSFLEKLKNKEPFFLEKENSKNVVIDNSDPKWSAVSEAKDIKELFKKGNATVLPTLKPKGTVKLSELAKSNLKVGAPVSAAAQTAMQELGTLWVMRQAIQKNKNFTSADSIKKDKTTWDELIKIWTLIGKSPEGPDKEWVDTFYQSNKAFLAKISNPSFTEFTRGREHANNSIYTLPGSKSSDTFMDWISNWVKTNYGISKKDNWNPADIWLIKNEDKWKTQIENSCSYDGPKSSPSARVNLEQLNVILREAYNKHEIIGISLKKITKGYDAIYVAVNTDEKFISDRSNVEFKKKYAYNKSKCYLNITDKGSMNQDTVVYCANEKISFQVKANSSSDKKGSGLKYEGTERPRTAARLGKATVSLVVSLMKQYGLDMNSDKNAYPFTVDEFEKARNEYEKKITILKTNKVEMVKSGSLTVEQSLDNLEYLFSKEPWVANSKCQQITWLSKILSLSSDNLNNFLADMVFIAKKEGSGYGPFGKIY